MLMHVSKRRTSLQKGFSYTYQEALEDHLAQPCQETLLQALDLGQAAFTAGIGIPDLLRLHHQALAEGPICSGEMARPDHFATALDSFLIAVLSPFEVDGRVAAGANDRRFGTREDHLEELAHRNAELQEEIAEHESAEEAMQAAKDHYFLLYQNARATEANLRDLSAQVLTAQEDERKRISRELHDEIGQALTAINVSIAMLKSQGVTDVAFQRNVAEAEQLLARTMETVHSFARELRPAMLDHLGIQSALRAHILDFARRTGIRTELVAHPLLARLDEGRGEVLFRVAQEALNNVYKHAQAESVRIEFTAGDGFLDMEVRDDGCAFNVESQLAGETNGRLGLIGMQERVRLVKGCLSIDSVPGRGTCVRVKIPVEAKPNGKVNGAAGSNGHSLPPRSAQGQKAKLYEENIRIAR